MTFLAFVLVVLVGAAHLRRRRGMDAPTDSVSAAATLAAEWDAWAERAAAGDADRTGKAAVLLDRMCCTDWAERLADGDPTTRRDVGIILISAAAADVVDRVDEIYIVLGLLGEAELCLLWPRLPEATRTALEAAAPAVIRR